MAAAQGALHHADEVVAGQHVLEEVETVELADGGGHALAVEIEMTSGIASPSACGQAITSTVTVRMTPSDGSPTSDQTSIVIAAAPVAMMKAAIVLSRSPEKTTIDSRSSMSCAGASSSSATRCSSSSRSWRATTAGSASTGRSSPSRDGASSDGSTDGR